MRYEKALDSLVLAEKMLFSEYLKVLENKYNSTKEKKVDQIKIEILIDEIYPTYAYLYNKSGRNKLAKFYESAVLNKSKNTQN